MSEQLWEIERLVVGKSLEEIETIILNHHGFCVTCHAPFVKGNIQSDSHIQGENVKITPDGRWIYFHCSTGYWPRPPMFTVADLQKRPKTPTCGYDSALWKVLQAIRIRDAKLRRGTA